MGLFDKIKKAFMGEEQQTQDKALEQTQEDSIEEDIPAEQPEATDTSEEDTLETPVNKENVPTPIEKTHGAEIADVPAEAEKQEQEQEFSLRQVDLAEQEEPKRRDPEEVARLEAQKYTEGLSKSRRSFTRRLNELFANFRYEDEEFFEELEYLLIESDVGFEATMYISEVMRHEAKIETIRTMKEAARVLVRTMVDLYGDTNPDYIEFNDQQDGLTVLLFVGVNGVGKTTTIAKMAHQYQEKGKKVILAAGDTFRAGAIEQLHVWGDRIGAEVVS